MSQGRLFRTLMTHSVKNADLVLQLYRCVNVIENWTSDFW